MSELEQKLLCTSCVGDEFLKSKIRREGERAECSYCGREAKKCMSIGDLAPLFEGVLMNSFHVTATEPSGLEYTLMKEGLRDWEREGEPTENVIASIGQLEPEPSRDIQQVLADQNSDFELAKMGEEQPFSEDVHFAEDETDPSTSMAGWREFVRRLKTETRYFSYSAFERLQSIFDGISDHSTWDGKKIIVEAGPEKKLSAVYRARVFQSDRKLMRAIERPDQHLGPPPTFLASAGRMNAHGISVFYGATDPEIALAEVRPPVGSRVLVGKFDFTRDVRLLDLVALRSVRGSGSFFDPECKEKSERAAFLKWLSAQMTLAVMPDDESLEYLPTQAVADFLANDEEAALDGILFPSVQGGESKLNIVLFHKSSRVQELDLPSGTRISAKLYEWAEEGEELAPWVWEEAPPANEKAESAKVEPSKFIPAISFEDLRTAMKPDDSRVAVLRVNTSELQIHEIKAVSVDTLAHKVHRHRRAKRGKAKRDPSADESASG